MGMGQRRSRVHEIAPSWRRREPVVAEHSKAVALRQTELAIATGCPEARSAAVREGFESSP